MINAKDQWLDVYQRENATTLKVMRAYLLDQADFKPHAISRTAKQLAWTFTIEQVVVKEARDGTLTMPPQSPRRSSASRSSSSPARGPSPTCR